MGTVCKPRTQALMLDAGATFIEFWRFNFMKIDPGKNARNLIKNSSGASVSPSRDGHCQFNGERRHLSGSRLINSRKDKQ